MTKAYKPTAQAKKQQNAPRPVLKLPVAAGVYGSAMATVNDRQRK